MTGMDGAPPASPPTPSQGADGGFNLSDVRGYLLWAVSYGVASAIALRTIDALTSKRTNQHETDQKPKEKGETAAATNPTVCNVVFPSVTTIINSNDSSTLVTKKEAASSETFQRGNETVAAASNRALGLFSLPRAEPKIPFVCKHIFDFYNDCFYSRSRNDCEGYAKLMKECQQMGSTSTNISNVSNPMLSVPPALILMSYKGCRTANFAKLGNPCKKYETYMSEIFKDSI